MDIQVRSAPMPATGKGRSGRDRDALHDLDHVRRRPGLRLRCAVTIRRRTPPTRAGADRPYVRRDCRPAGPHRHGPFYSDNGWLAGPGRDKADTGPAGRGRHAGRWPSRSRRTWSRCRPARPTRSRKNWPSPGRPGLGAPPAARAPRRLVTDLDGESSGSMTCGELGPLTLNEAKSAARATLVRPRTSTSRRSATTKPVTGRNTPSRRSARGGTRRRARSFPVWATTESPAWPARRPP